MSYEITPSLFPYSTLYCTTRPFYRVLFFLWTKHSKRYRRRVLITDENPLHWGVVYEYTLRTRTRTGDLGSSGPVFHFFPVLRHSRFTQFGYTSQVRSTRTPLSTPWFSYTVLRLYDPLSCGKICLPSCTLSDTTLFRTMQTFSPVTAISCLSTPFHRFTLKPHPFPVRYRGVQKPVRLQKPQVRCWVSRWWLNKVHTILDVLTYVRGRVPYRPCLNVNLSSVTDVTLFHQLSFGLSDSILVDS